MTPTSVPGGAAAGRGAGRRLHPLRGEWFVALDPEDLGRSGRWFERGPPAPARQTPIPAIIQQVFPGYFGVAWYWHRFTARHPPVAGERALLRFGAVDYRAEAWLNGVPLGGHEGGETPFTLDVTGALRPAGEENLLAVRVLNPTEERIDGIVLAETPRRTKQMAPLHPPMRLNHGGMMGEVDLVVVPEVHLEDVWVRPAATGEVSVRVTLSNSGGAARTAQLLASVGPASDGSGPTDEAGMEDAQVSRMVVPPGPSDHALTLRVAAPRLWELEDPFLYRVRVRVASGVAGGVAVPGSETPRETPRASEDETSVRCGFRDFRVVDGFFRLNGRRVLLRSAHTGNHSPVGQQLSPPGSDVLQRDIVFAKATGFNAIRFLAGMPRPAQLNLCDELGLLVYEESYASWLMTDSPYLAERFDHSTREMIRRDRNHPCVVVWGLLNETRDGPVFRHAVKTLDLVRALDPDRLVLLSSGRWDGDHGIGSVSNPGSAVWEHVWGAEEPGAPDVAAPRDALPGGYFPGAGDAHVYPKVPQPASSDALLRTLGSGTKPVFLSEYGIGSLPDVVRSARMYEQTGARPDLEDAQLFRAMSERLETDWHRYGMDGVYPFVEDFLLDSERRHARWRRRAFDIVRSNPRLCGYNVTGLLDHSYTGEGLWSFWREWKEGIADTLRDGWAPLRWCLFVQPMHVEVGRPFTVEAVLASEDVLAPGDYPAVFRLSGPAGRAWERRVAVRVPAPAATALPALAVPALCEPVTLHGAPGRYTLTADLQRGGAPAGRQVAFFVSAPVSAAGPWAGATVALWGIDATAQSWLEGRGVRCRPLRPLRPLDIGPGSSEGAEPILVGDVSTSATDAEWETLVEHVRRGAMAVFLEPAAFRHGDDSTARLPLARRGRCYRFNNWLYHREDVARRHAVFEGLPVPGILDWDYYDQVIAEWLFDGQDAPDEVLVAAFAVGYPGPTGNVAGLVLGAYRVGEGRIVLNTLRILEHVGTQPAAERLLLNLVAYATAKA